MLARTARNRLITLHEQKPLRTAGAQHYHPSNSSKEEADGVCSKSSSFWFHHLDDKKYIIKGGYDKYAVKRGFITSARNPRDERRDQIRPPASSTHNY
jgi:hypothetical protein